MNKNQWITGFAVFTMFFGAGNIVFPLHLAQLWPGSWVASWAGFVISAVILSLMGLVAGIFLKGQIEKFFAPLGALLGFGFQLVLVSIEGPFGVVPRCLMVASGGIRFLFPQVPEVYIYALLCVLLFLLAYNQEKMVAFIGQYITPVMIVSLFFLMIATMNRFGLQDQKIPSFSWQAFLSGIKNGYMTYDLPGSIYFSAIAISFLRENNKGKQSIIRNGIIASLIATLLLAIVYLAFFYLGVSYHDSINGVEWEQILPTITQVALGQELTVVFSIFVLMACLTTAVAALSIWTQFIHNCLRRLALDLKFSTVLFASTILTFVMCTLRFSGLAALLVPILDTIYPILIGLTLWQLYVCFKLRNDSKSASMH